MSNKENVIIPWEIGLNLFMIDTKSRLHHLLDKENIMFLSERLLKRPGQIIQYPGMPQPVLFPYNVLRLTVRQELINHTSDRHRVKRDMSDLAKSPIPFKKNKLTKLILN